MIFVFMSNQTIHNLEEISIFEKFRPYTPGGLGVEPGAVEQKDA
jgi:hypothetical protein